ncbi:hypothetical protein [Actinacidiphila oryziradicis]|uniref:Uncharacterized protein n=1 Tax=Actinacidiphila oryziradicis TaxID=2571141 RepID=A0A4U0SHE2_9ACTN|nr:hypothetical protein [Actinacidiphila oryziradicis]TKA09090.1 hypothetical protein FCI23_25100 [Actinacidiphila oryziradicis]
MTFHHTDGRYECLHDGCPGELKAAHFPDAWYFIHPGREECEGWCALPPARSRAKRGERGRKKPGENIRVTPEAWYAEVVGDPEEAPPERLQGRRLALLKAMEAGGNDAVRELVESWGLVGKVGPRGGIRVELPPAE